LFTISAAESTCYEYVGDGTGIVAKSRLKQIYSQIEDEKKDVIYFFTPMTMEQILQF
jgi:hypothetical protein